MLRTNDIKEFIFAKTKDALLLLFSLMNFVCKMVYASFCLAAFSLLARAAFPPSPLPLWVFVYSLAQFLYLLFGGSGKNRKFYIILIFLMAITDAVILYAYFEEARPVLLKYLHRDW